MFPLHFPKPSLFVALDIQAVTVCLLQLKKYRKNWQVSATRVADLPSGVIQDGKIMQPDQLKNVLQSLVIQTNSQGSVSAIALPGSCVLRRKIAFSGLSREEEYAAEMDMHLEKYLPGVSDPIYFDYQFLGSELSSRQAILTAAKSEIVNGYIDIINKSGLMLKIIDIDYYAYARAINRYSGDKNKMVGMINIDFYSVNILFVSKTELLFTQQLTIQYTDFITNLSNYMNHAIKMCHSDLVDQLIKIDCIYLTGKKSLISEVADELARFLDSKIEVPDLKKIFLISSEIDEEQASTDMLQSLVSVGLGLRGVV